MCCRQRLLTVVCCFAAVVLAVGGVAAGDTGGPDTTVTGPDIDGAERQPAPEAESGEGTVEVLVWVDRERPAASAPERLRASANRTQAPLRAFATRRGGVTIENSFWLANAALVRVDTGRVSVGALSNVEGVRSVTANAAVQVADGGVTTGAAARSRAIATGGTLEHGESTYGLSTIRVSPVWEATGTRGEGTAVAVLDTGVDPAHPDIDLSRWAEFDEDGNEVDSEPQEYDPGGHGTHVSGTVTGGAAGGTHIGVAPDATLYHAAVLTDCGGTCSGTLAQVIEGMEWGVDNGADVLSMSLGGQGYVDEFIEPVRNAELMGTAVVAAVGNGGEGTSNSPANVYDVISVGATDESDDVSGFSAGEEIDTIEAWTAPPPDWPPEYVVPSVTAPGRSVLSADPGGGYSSKSGTSMATPHVAGAVTLLQSATEERFSPPEIEAALEETASKPDDAPAPPGERDTRYGAGIVDVPDALVELGGPVPAFDTDPANPRPDESTAFDAGKTLGNVDSYEWDFTGDGNTDASGETASYTFEDIGRVNVTLTVTDNESRTRSKQRPVYVGLEPVVGDSYPTDPNGDGLYRDVDGNGRFDIFDVQVFFANFRTDPVQNNTEAFDFDETDDIDIADVQALFDDL